MIHRYSWSLKHKRQFNNYDKFATLLIKLQFHWVLWSLFQTVVNYHIYCQKILTQFPTKLSATTQLTQTHHNHAYASYLYMKHKYDTVITEPFQCGAQLWHNDVRSWELSLFQLVTVLLHIYSSLPTENIMTDSHLK